MKRSPYYFMRQQAERRLQASFWATVGLIIVMGAAVAVASESPVDNVVRMAVLQNAKPIAVAEGSGPVDLDDIPVIALDSPETFDSRTASLGGDVVSLSAPVGEPPADLEAETAGEEPTLPAEFDNFESTAELTPETAITPLVFSAEITEDYDPISPRRLYGEGFFTIYATFDYEGMADGMEWAWVWRRNGEVVNGGNEMWTYGDDGPGWIYYEPPEGFSAGDYTLEVWINDELFQEASLSIQSGTVNR
ncbi:MAG: hypothetical protein R3272_01490 [Candidatus Promineifilaceae bacterium]|nr:hypothetical protein [Candidatus Promineifilaceae bacterium]